MSFDIDKLVQMIHEAKEASVGAVSWAYSDVLRMIEYIKERQNENL